MILVEPAWTRFAIKFVGVVVSKTDAKAMDLYVDDTGCLKGNLVRLYVDLLGAFGLRPLSTWPQRIWWKQIDKSIERHVIHLHTVFCLTTGKPVATVHDCTHVYFHPRKDRRVESVVPFSSFRNCVCVTPDLPPEARVERMSVHANRVMLHPGSGDIYMIW